MPVPVPSSLTSLFDERDRWFLWLPVLGAFGIGLYFALPFEPSLAWLAVAPALAALVFWLRAHQIALPAAAALLAFALGFNVAQIQTHLAEAPMLSAPLAPTSITGRLMRAEPVPGGSRLLIKKPFIRDIPEEDRLRFVRIKVKTPFAELPEPGERINVWGPLWPPSAPVAPDDYDFRRNAFFKQLGASGMSYGEIRERESHYPPRFFWDGFNLMFEKARRALTLMAMNRIEGPPGAMTAALLSGSQAGIDKDTMQAMRTSGLSHLLSISGVHVSAMGLLLYFPLRALLALIPWIALRYPIKKWAAFAAILGTSFYTILVGPEAPTVRSALMTGIVMFAVIVDRKAMSLRLVALAAGLVMMVEPSAVIGPSFQMSFAAVLAMVVAFEKRIDDALKQGMRFDIPGWLRGTWRHIRDIVLTSLVATAATAPFTLFHFNVFSFWGVVANMVAIPLTSFWIMPCLLLAYITAPFGGEAMFVTAAGEGVRVLIAIANHVAAWPYAQIFAPPMPVWAFLLSIFGGLWFCLWRKAWRWLGLLPIAVALTYPLTVPLPIAFVAEEGKDWAVRLEDGRLATFGKRAENFTIHQWRQRTLNPEVLYFLKKNPPNVGEALKCEDGLTDAHVENRPQGHERSRGARRSPNKETPEKQEETPGQRQVRRGASDVKLDVRTRGDSHYCLFKREGLALAFLPKRAKPEVIQAACGAAAVVISPVELSDCRAPQIIDARALREKGAHALYSEGGQLRIETARPMRGQRPWSVGWKEIVKTENASEEINTSEPGQPADPAP